MSHVNGVIGIGAIICNSDGSLMAAISKSFTLLLLPLATKLLAIKEALEFCVQMGFLEGKLSTNSNEAVRVVSYSNPYLEKEFHLVEYIKATLVTFVNFLRTFVPEAANRACSFVSKTLYLYIILKLGWRMLFHGCSLRFILVCVMVLVFNKNLLVFFKKIIIIRMIQK